ncbi:transcriptional regulator GcvA [Rhodospirillaceae bacterium SYSU D60014]|uniref:transcriptional regulator GcvA n=1 Tax=Virgifigura deserti TaxID=2268457 RepID=UPI0013C3F0BC
MTPRSTDSQASRDLPLHALRVFEVCARHLNFTKAARELRVTQAAVSQQIAGLEAYLGLHLFRRVGRGVVLTDDGTSYLIAVREALAHLDLATRKLRARRDEAVIICSIATTIAMRWLVPRLRGFTLAHPGTEVRLSITERFVDFAREDVDIAIRYGAGTWPGVVSDLLFRESLVPVCSPELLRGERPIARPADLAGHTLLHSANSLQDWAHWLAATGTNGIDAKRGLIFDQPHLALQAAADALGVAIADRSLVEAEIASGRLATPFDVKLARAEGYYVVGPAAARDSLQVGPFWHWLLAQAVTKS